MYQHPKETSPSLHHNLQKKKKNYKKHDLSLLNDLGTHKSCIFNFHSIAYNVNYVDIINERFDFCTADVKADAHMKGKLIKKKGQEYVEIKDTVVKLTVKAAKAHFGNLFNGDPTLSTYVLVVFFFCWLS